MNRRKTNLILYVWDPHKNMIPKGSPIIEADIPLGVKDQSRGLASKGEEGHSQDAKEVLSLAVCPAAQVSLSDKKSSLIRAPFLGQCVCTESITHSVVSSSLRPPWTVACQALLSMGFSGKNTGVGCHLLL